MLLRISAVWMLAWSLLIIPMNLSLVSEVALNLRAWSFATAEGEVTQSEVIEQHANEVGESPLQFNYRFRAGDREFVGDRVRYVRTTPGGQRAKAFVKAHPVGQKVDVFYDVGHPEESVLLRNIGGEPFLTALILAPFNMVLIAGWSGIARRFRKQCLWPLEREGSRWLIRRYPGNPLFVALILVGTLSLLAAMVVTTGGWSDSLATMLCIWAFILAWAAFGYIQTRASASSEPPCLILDDVSRMLIWPAQNPEPEFQIAADQVLHVELDIEGDASEIANTETKSASSISEYCVIVTVQNPEGEPIQRLVLQTTKALAGQELAEWIQDWVAPQPNR